MRRGETGRGGAGRDEALRGLAVRRRGGSAAARRRRGGAMRGKLAGQDGSEAGWRGGMAPRGVVAGLQKLHGVTA